MFVRFGSFLAMMLIAVLALASCGTPDKKVEPTVTRIPNPANAPIIAPTNAPSGAAVATVPSANPPMTIDLQLEDIKFDKSELTVPANTQITVNLKNAGAATHNFNIDKLNVHSGDVAGGGTGSVTFNSGAAGEYEYYCNIPGHKEAGMVGKLIVTANAEGGAAGAASPTEVASAPPGGTATQPAEAQAGAGQTTFDVELKDIAFNVTEMTVPANAEITVNLKNTGAAVHNFNIDELNVHSGDLAAGESKTITFNSGAAGSYQYFCNIPGHKEAGMVGKLTVTGGAAGGATGSATSASPAPSAAAQATTAPAAAAQTTFDVELKDIAFDVTKMEVPANAEITINLKNTGAAVHNFNIDELNVHSGDMASGESKTVTFNSGAAGSYQYYCNVPGHKEAGMVGTLTVTGGAATVASPAPSPAAQATPAPAGAAAQTTFEIELKDIAFSQTKIEVPANADITISLKNTGAAVHNFNIDALNVHSGDLSAGASSTVTFNSGAPAEYQFYCNVPGHKEAGMVGTLTVVAGGGAPTTGGAAATPSASAATPSPAAPAAQTTFDVQLKDIAFDVTKMTVPANTEITVNLVNAGAAVHNFNIDELNVHSGDLAAGAKKTITFNSGTPAEYQYYCNIPGHKEAGMVGKLTVVGGGGGATASPVASPVAASPAASAGQTTFDLKLKDIAFDVKTMSVPANTRITINITNTGAAVHNFNIDELNVHSGDVAPGTSTTVTFDSGAAGKYTYYCNIPGHKEAGMVGQLTIE